MGMTRFSLVYDTLGTIHSNLELPLYLEYFNVELYDPNKSYNPTATLYYTDSGKKTPIHDMFIQRGFRVVYDNLQEPGTIIKSQQGYVMHNQNYFWYHDSLLMIDHSYHNYCPNKTYKKTALMPMRLQRSYRTMLLENLASYLDDFYWSYVEFGRQLPDDVSMENHQGQRYFNPLWYNDTYFSVVSESCIHKKSPDTLHITEKTFKPIAFRHPFIVWGQIGTLQRLKELGFETFENLFDESYDTIPNPQQRLNVIVNNISNFKKQPYDQTTLEKLHHNHARFFDRHLIEQRMRTEIIEPLLAYAESSQ
jgi:hypothetical protein